MQVLDDIDPGRVGLAVFGLALALILGFVVYSFLGVFVLGVFLYYATRPFFRRFERYLPGSVAAALSLFVLAAPAALLIAYTAAVGYGELAALADRIGIEALQRLVPEGIEVDAALRDPGSLLTGADAGTAAEVFQAALGYLGAVLSSVLDLVVAFAIAFYLLRDGGRLRGLLERYLDGHSPALGGETLEDYFDAIDADLETVFFGNILNALLIAAIGAIAYSVLARFAPATHVVGYPVLLGILAGAASLIPVVGMKLVYVPVVAYLAGVSVLTGSGWGYVAAFAAVSVVVVDTVPDLALRPWVSGGDLHLGTVMFAYIFGPLIFGWYGLFLGPLVLVLAVHFYRIVLDIDATDGEPEPSPGGEPEPEPERPETPEEPAPESEGEGTPS
jgi:predicted PurR-regulated permease PerM